MPHIIVEYAEDIVLDDDINDVLNAIHTACTSSGLFDESHIKTRAYPFKNYTNAGKQDPYMHIQARIKSGRDIDNKKQLSFAIITGLEALGLKASVITVEVVDMDRESYAKFKP